MDDNRFINFWGRYFHNVGKKEYLKYRLKYTNTKSCVKNKKEQVGEFFLFKLDLYVLATFKNIFWT